MEEVIEKTDKLKGAVAYAEKFGIQGSGNVGRNPGRNNGRDAGRDHGIYNEEDAGRDDGIYNGRVSGVKNSSTHRMSPSDLLSFLQQQYRASFYRFVPAEVIYMDNSIRIGFKQEIKL